MQHWKNKENKNKDPINLQLLDRCIPNKAHISFIYRLYVNSEWIQKLRTTFGIPCYVVNNTLINHEQLWHKITIAFLGMLYKPSFISFFLCVFYE